MDDDKDTIPVNIYFEGGVTCSNLQISYVLSSPILALNGYKYGRETVKDPYCGTHIVNWPPKREIYTYI